MRSSIMPRVHGASGGGVSTRCATTPTSATPVTTVELWPLPSAQLEAGSSVDDELNAMKAALPSAVRRHARLVQSDAGTMELVGGSHAVLEAPWEARPRV